MKSIRQLTAIIEREDDACVALCPLLDIAKVPILPKSLAAFRASSS